MKSINKDIDSEDGILEDSKQCDGLLVSFGGKKRGLGMPVFEFFKAVKEINCDKLFVRDFNHAWYQKGVDSTINDFEKLLAFLKNYIEKGNYKKVVFLGNSMGGYAAILFGTMLNVNSVISFVPQTFFDRKNGLIYCDFRSFRQRRKAEKLSGKMGYADLKSFLSNNQNYLTKINIYYSPKHRLDKIHSTRMKKLRGINLFPQSVGGHRVVKEMRDNGALREILNDQFV